MFVYQRVDLYSSSLAIAADRALHQAEDRWNWHQSLGVTWVEKVCTMKGLEMLREFQSSSLQVGFRFSCFIGSGCREHNIYIWSHLNWFPDVSRFPYVSTGWAKTVHSYNRHARRGGSGLCELIDFIKMGAVTCAEVQKKDGAPPL